MILPEYAADCIRTLEAAGFAAYAVGGCVRDSLLGITPHDFDLCTDALPDAMEAVFAGHRLVLAGKKHGTVGVVTPGGVVEITTFRQEGSYADNRRPDWVRFVPDIREDLSRRDFTVNAIAWSPTRGLQDPFGGAGDLSRRVLRAVGDPVTRFREDSLRILRGIRFSVTYGLEPEEATCAAMHSQAALMDNLARERVFDELTRILLRIDCPGLLRFGSLIAQPIPELAPMLGFDQHSPYHAYDLFTHTAHVVAAVPAEPVLRWAALLHDVGKVPTFTMDAEGIGHFYGHAQTGADMADSILRRLRAPTALREQAVLLIRQHMTRLQPDRKFLRRQLSRLGGESLEQLLILQEADMGSKGSGSSEQWFGQIRSMLDLLRTGDTCLTLKELAVNGNDLIALGYQGREIGRKLNLLLRQVVDETLPNDREALLAALRANEEN